ncbi:MAG: OmpA family protein [Paludibacteraceae bacterium]|nr:OmpA family protein [Paludibacteraceae bacterium]
MNNTSKILTICLALMFSMLVCPVMTIPASAAVSQTQAQKQNAQRQKEAEKKRKAQEKQKQQRLKEQAKRQKEREKAEAQRQDNKARQTAENAKTKPSAGNNAKSDARSQSIIGATDAYERRVAEIEAQNRKIIARSRRDLTHAIGVWGMMGYSAMFQNIKEADDGTGFSAKTLGGFGGGAGLGYQLRYNNFLFNTGVEFEMYNSDTKLYSPSVSDDLLARTYSVAEYPTMSYDYRFRMNDKWSGGFVQIPVLFGGEWGRWYFLAGPKVGIGVLGKSEVSSVLSTDLYDVELPDKIFDIGSHSVVTDRDMGVNAGTLKYNVNLGLAAEAGIYLDEWLQPKPKKAKGRGRQKQEDNFLSHLRYRLGVYADYGLLSVQSGKNLADGAIDIPPVLPGNPDPLVYPVNSALSTTYAAGARVNPFLVGVKLAIFYQFPKKQEKLIPIPAQPMPLFRAKVVDAETGKPVQGVMLSMYNTVKDKQSSKTSNKDGVVIQRMPKAEYQLWALRAGYEPSDTLSLMLSKDMADTLLISIKAEEVPTIYYLTAYVRDAETNNPLAVQVAIADGTTQVYSGETTEDGLLATDLLPGTYYAHLSTAGFMPLDDTLRFEQDTLSIYMQRIKEGKKVVLHNLFFATNKTQILPESEEALEELAQFLTDNPTVEILITGHTDAVGSDAANQRLSEGRAKAVCDDLIMRGVSAERIASEGKGESEPIATNDTEEGRALNRRVEFTITATGGEDIRQISE